MSPSASLGEVSPLDLVGERLALHSAAQMAGWLGRRLLPASYGPIRAALFWDKRHGGTLIGAPIGGPGAAREIRVGVGFDPPALLVLDGGAAAVREQLELDGATVTDTWARITSAVRRAGIDTTDLPPLPSDLLPSDGLRSGAPFRIEPARATQLGQWFALADEVLDEEAIAKGLPSNVPCWSHHFDMAVVVPLEGGDQAQITLGFSPGDDSIAEPYLYVLPWPPPADRAALPESPSPGRWQHEPWTGLALPGSVLLAGGPAQDLRAVARSFLERGFEVARSGALAR